MLKRDKIARFCAPPALALLALALALAAPACSFGKPDIATVPAHPTFEIDVKPLFADHCLLCHGYPAKRNAPTSFRLDVYTSPDSLPAAQAEGSRSVRSILNDHMPPSAAWGDGVGPNGKKMLQNWAADGYPD
jgi:hypothetical protein